MDSIKKAAADAKKAAPAPRKVVEEQKEPAKEFTAEEAANAKEILRCKDYYALLGVDRNATDSQLKKAYHKKALKVHPDKNNAPQASEAFKRVNAAMACLSDADKRRVYNQVGSIEAFENKESNSGGGGGGGFGGFHGHHGRHFQQGHEFVSPEDFFNFMFFGQEPQRGRGGGRHQREHQQHHRRRAQGNENEGELLLKQLGPLLLFVLVTLLSSVLSGGLFDQGGAAYPYSLQRTYQFREELVSYRLNQIYYVSPYTVRDFKYD